VILNVQSLDGDVEDVQILEKREREHPIQRVGCQMVEIVHDHHQVNDDYSVNRNHQENADYIQKKNLLRLL
jgi:hypothetical protein